MSAFPDLPLQAPSDLAVIDAIAERFDAQWDPAQPPRLADFLREAPEHLRPRLAVELACVDLEQRVRHDLPVDLGAYPVASPELEAHQRRLLGLESTLTSLPHVAAGPAAAPARIGRYPIHQEIGRGGQATTYLGLHPTLGQPVVLKWLNAELARDADHGERLAREGQLLAQMSHAHIVRVHDLDVHQGRPFLVMEHVEGRTLLRYAQEEHPSPAEAARLVACLAEAVAHAHARGITHQDINPRNVLVDEDGQVCLIDFGLAWYRPAWTEGEDRLNTASGTPKYLSPEQARGQVDSIGPATDVFGLGAVLYFLLTGMPPYAGQTLNEVLTQAARGACDLEALDRPEVPRRLRRVCQQALAVRPADRPTAHELATALVARPARRWRRPLRRWSRWAGRASSEGPR
jgi:serine/threonine protein kinase